MVGVVGEVVGEVVAVVEVVVVGVVDVVVVVGVGVVVVGVTGVPVGAGQLAVAPGPVVCPTGTVPTTVPLWSRPTTEAPSRLAWPVATSTTIPLFGAMESTTTPPTLNWAEATPSPTETATQPTGAPSVVPKEPEPSTSKAPEVMGAVAGSETEPVPTAWSVDSSRTSVVQPDTGPEVGAVASDPTGWPDVTARDPDGATPSTGGLVDPVVPPDTWGTNGSAQLAPFGHSGLDGTVVPGVHTTAGPHPPLVVEPAV